MARDFPDPPESTVGAQQLRHIADPAPDFHGLMTESQPVTVAIPSVGGSRVMSLLISVLLPAPLGPSNPKRA